MYLFNHDYPQDSLDLYIDMRGSSCKGGGGIIDRASAALVAPKRLHGVLMGVHGVSTPLSRDICISKFNSRNLVNTFCHHYTENPFIRSR